MPTIEIAGTSIDIPETGASPIWSSAIIQALQAIATALSSSVGAYDVSPQIYTMVSNSNTSVSLPNLSFPTSQVRAAFIKYSVYRHTNSTTAVEAGTMIVVYNGSTWEKIQNYAGGASVTFAIDNTGQISFSSSSISGTGHTGKISYAGQCLLQS